MKQDYIKLNDRLGITKEVINGNWIFFLAREWGTWAETMVMAAKCQQIHKLF